MCSAVVVDVDLSTRTVTHACGGHPAPLVARRGQVEELEAGGTFVGIEQGTTYPSWKRQLAPDEGLYLVTDGLAEARRANGEFFGEERLHRAVAEANELPSGVGDAIFARLESWLRPETQTDDVTIVAVRPAHA
jgi:phosphoserine phosphatase RsbU/P